MEKKNRKAKIKIAVFGTALGLLSILGLLWFLRPEVSELEKRRLTELPEFTLSSFLSGEWAAGIDKWYADTYPAREPMIAGYQKLQQLYGLRGEQLAGGGDTAADEIPDIVEGEGFDPAAGDSEGEGEASEGEATTQAPANEDPAKTAFTGRGGATGYNGTDLHRETADDKSSEEEPVSEGEADVSDFGGFQGKIYVTNNSGYGVYYFNQQATEAFADAMNRSFERVGNLAELYCVIAPISAGVMLDEAVVKHMGGSDEGKALQYLYSRMNPNIHRINAFNNLKEHNDEYIYFHTDHHWTQLGAYYAYEEFCRSKGVEAHKLSDFQRADYPGFLGTFYNETGRSAAIAANPDTVEAYIPMGTNDMTLVQKNGASISWRIVNDVSSYSSGGKYGAYAGGDNPWSYAHNESINDGSAVLIIKDSYGNAFIPWLVDHYEYTYWIDVRYSDLRVSDLVRDYGIQDVVVMFNIYNTAASGIRDRLEHLLS